MSFSCTVLYWKAAKKFGFAQCENGKTVYVNGSEIDGQALKAGETIYCDLVEVEGHEGRVKGINVNGPGIVSADYAPDAEEQKAIDAAWDKYKAEHFKEREKKEKGAKGKGTKGTKGGKGGKSSKGVGAPAAAPAAAGRGSGKAAKGGKGGKGSRIAGAPRKAHPVIPARDPEPVQKELRVDPADGQQYSKENFKACYGGYREWDAAKPVSKPKPVPRQPPVRDAAPRGVRRDTPAAARPSGRGAGRLVERRVDPADGATYTREEFMVCYGGTREWDRARARPTAQSPIGRGARLY
eukprot:TRINITY_DN2958_c0_g2_i4.p1 TRINITY_DN2958_c0_g2~~TRINITY_DN2958_c0_g2_i4.p1  ORF type:complete len:296 (+),score=64.86 TRINITY_DN2958_c0_g2_i4:89-976(+)